MILKPGVLLVLWIYSAAGTDMCEMSATRISCTPRETSSLLGQCGMEESNPFELGVMADAIRQFIPHVPSQQCRKQLVTFADALTNSSPWAVQMVDATATTIEPGGYHLGHFDECIDVNVTRGTDSILGKYCLADVSECGEFRGSRIGICVPNGCGNEEVEVVLGRYLSEVMKRDVAVQVREYACTGKDSTGGKTGSALFQYGVLGLVLWSVFLTVLDLVSTKWETSKTWRKLVDVFSCYRHMVKLTDPRTAAGLSGIHLLRVTTIFVLIMYERHRLMMEGPVKNRSYLEKVSVSPWPIFDSLIFLTGFLTVQRLQNTSLTMTKWNCFLLCFWRWLRMMPLYGAVIAFYAVAFGNVATGPLWSERIGRESRRCGDFWWANLSLVNNYISATGQCIAQSWYLAVTSHGFVVTLIFMHLKTGKAFVGLGSLAVSITTSLVLFLWNDYTLHSHDQPSTFEDLYIKTQYRLSSFLFGAMSALLYYRIRLNKEKTNWVHFLMPFLLAILGLASILCHRAGADGKMLFAVVSSLTWSVFIGCIILIFPLYNISLSKGTLLKNIVIPLSRLSYPALLSHNIVQLYLIGTMRTSEYVTFSRLALMGVVDILASYVSALFLHLIIDGAAISAIKMTFCSEDREMHHTAEEDAEKK